MAGKKVPDIQVDSVGRTACPKCGEVVDVSDRKAFSIADCDHCGAQFATPGKLGQFILLKALGAGGMGATFKAYERSLDRHVAIKIMHPPDEEKASRYIDRFFAEARALASLDHPNVARAYSVGESKGQPFLVMELIIGNALDQLFKVTTPLDEAMTLEIGSQVASALRGAHKIGLIHSDVKPANILVDADGNAKLVDFGIARFGGGRITSDDALGTPYYLSPEQVRRQTLDFRTDIYSLGATLYHALSGKPPFSGKHAKDVIVARLKAPAPYLLAARPTLRRSTADVVAKMMKANPAERYGNYDELVRDLSLAAEVARTGGEGGPMPLGAHELNAPGFPDDRPHPGQPSHPGQETSTRRKRLVWGVIAALVLAAAGVGIWAMMPGEDQTSDDGTAVKAPDVNPNARPQIDNPVFDPAPGPIPQALKVKVSCPTSGAVIHYTMNGSDPTERDGEWTEPSLVPPGTIIKVRAYHPKYRPSEIVTAHYVEEKLDIPKLVQLGAEADKAWNGVKNIDRGQGFAARLDACNPLLARANKHRDRDQWGDAETLWRKLISSCKEIAAMEAIRAKAVSARQEAEKTGNGVSKVKPPSAEFLAYQRDAAAAGKAFNAGQFPEAVTLWISAKGHALQAGTDMIKEVIAAFDAAKDRHNLTDLQMHGGDEWRRYNDAVVAARRAEANLTPGDVVARYRQAIAILPRVAAEAAKGIAAAKKAEAAAKAKKEEDDRKIVAMHKEARKFLADKAYDEALAKAKAALALNPNDPKSQKLVQEIEGKLKLTIKLDDATTMTFVLIRPGKFKMGSPEDEERRNEDEHQHDVELTGMFYMSIHEVTVAQFDAFVKSSKYRTMAEKIRGGWADVYVQRGREWQLSRETDKKMSWRNCGFPQDPKHPVVCVSWYDAKKACEWFSRKAGAVVRLPTEAEWEYACRAGTTTPFVFGKEEKQLKDSGNFADKRAPVRPRFDQAEDKTTWTSPVGTYRPNAWGLYDMHGNVAEWCEEGGGQYPTGKTLTRNPRSSYNSRYRAVRGGAWNSLPKDCRSAFRHRAIPVYRSSAIGFRVVVEIK